MPIAHVVFSAMHRLSNEEKKLLFDYCSDILQKTGNYDEIKVIVFAVRGEWENLSDTIIEKMRNGDAFIDFIFEYLYNYIVDDERCIRMEVEAVFIAMLNDLNCKIYTVLKDYRYSNKVAQAIKSYEQNIEF